MSPFGREDRTWQFMLPVAYRDGEYFLCFMLLRKIGYFVETSLKVPSSYLYLLLVWRGKKTSAAAIAAVVLELSRLRADLEGQVQAEKYRMRLRNLLVT
jgi:hypothetical protein